MFCGPETADVSLVHKTYCFPRSQSISVNYYILSVKVHFFLFLIGYERIT